MQRRVFGLLVGLGMLVMGVLQMMRGVRELSGPSMGDLLERPLPATVTTRPWEACTPEESAYAATRPAWALPPAVDVGAPWTLPQRATAAALVFPPGAAPGSPLPRDCTASGGAAFRRMIATDPIELIAADESASAAGRARAIAMYMEGVSPAITGYCGEPGLDDYQWECIRMTIAMQRLSTTLLTLVPRAEAEDPALARETSWSHGLSMIRGAIPTTTTDGLRLLELPAGVRPAVRALIAHMLAEDAPAARALASDPGAFVPLRARLVALSERETQPEVREALALALTRWPG